MTDVSPDIGAAEIAILRRQLALGQVGAPDTVRRLLDAIEALAHSLDETQRWLATAQADLDAERAKVERLREGIDTFVELACDPCSTAATLRLYHRDLQELTATEPADV